MAGSRSGERQCTFLEARCVRTLPPPREHTGVQRCVCRAKQTLCKPGDSNWLVVLLYHIHCQPQLVRGTCPHLWLTACSKEDVIVHTSDFKYLDKSTPEDSVRLAVCSLQGLEILGQHVISCYRVQKVLNYGLHRHAGTLLRGRLEFLPARRRERIVSHGGYCNSGSHRCRWCRGH